MPTLDGQIRAWHAGQPEPAFANKWRTPERTRALAITFFRALALSLVFLAAVAVWTLLRGTIDRKDTAPRNNLDGYEQVVLDTWRARALSILTTLLIVGALLFFAVGLIFDDVVDVASFALIAALYLGYALTFNQPSED